MQLPNSRQTILVTYVTQREKTSKTVQKINLDFFPFSGTYTVPPISFETVPRKSRLVAQSL